MYLRAPRVGYIPIGERHLRALIKKLNPQFRVGERGEIESFALGPGYEINRVISFKELHPINPKPTRRLDIKDIATSFIRGKKREIDYIINNPEFSKYVIDQDILERCKIDLVDHEMFSKIYFWATHHGAKVYKTDLKNISKKTRAHEVFRTLTFNEVGSIANVKFALNSSITLGNFEATAVLAHWLIRQNINELNNFRNTNYSNRRIFKILSDIIDYYDKREEKIKAEKDELINKYRRSRFAPEQRYVIKFNY